MVFFILIGRCSLLSCKLLLNHLKDSSKLTMKYMLSVLCCRALTLMRARLRGAQKGHSLLKKKSDALTMKFRGILKKIIEVLSLPSLLLPLPFSRII